MTNKAASVKLWGSNIVQHKGNTPLESAPGSDSNLDLGADDHVVDWDGPEDVANPVNWPARKRWANILMISILGLITNLAPAICAPGINGIAVDLDIHSEVVSTLAITFYVLGLAVGPMVISPLSEVYGRLPVYHVSNLVFVALVVGNALSNTVGPFLVCRFISGCAGGVPMALGGGSIADLTHLPKRSLAMTLFSLGSLTGPILGPLIGGFIATTKGWRWTFWVLAIGGGAAGVAALVTLRETHPRVLLERKAAQLRAKTGNPHLRSKLALPLPPRRVLNRALVRPTMLLLRSPIVLVLSLYVGLIFGIMYLLFTTFTSVFEGQYGFTTATSGLVYLGLGISMLFSVPIFNSLNKRMMAQAVANGQPSPPLEQRLLPMIWFSPSVAVGLFIYGWTAQYKVHWIVPIIGTTFIGYGTFFILMSTQLYLVNLFGSEGAASALGANLLLRYISGTFLPLAGPKMYRTLHYGWGNSLLALLSLAFLPFPILFYKYGERFRAKTAVKL
ncbi:major facilitator superfamily domain-containing protein [Achaetomium macrosporum]|uniref:Major facilitator superfamily domain-containing protein n=1 Tax=Achaetomium macrosporum TaxID=79813 RepID=A0AAN7C3R4_9PEZI|nr:major facilitator superfamily domain-containing protein [Achaetomium macrosporum]